MARTSTWPVGGCGGNETAPRKAADSEAKENRCRIAKARLKRGREVDTGYAREVHESRQPPWNMATAITDTEGERECRHANTGIGNRNR